MQSTFTKRLLHGLSSKNSSLLYSRLFMLVILVNTLIKMVQEKLELSPAVFWVILLATLLLSVRAMIVHHIGHRWQHWAVVSSAAALYLISEWPGPGNHLYVYIYLSIVLVIVHINDKNQWSGVWTTNTRTLFLLIMGLAVIQKVITPAYMDGSINSFWIVNGGYFQPIYYFFESWSNTTSANHDQLNAYYNQYQTSTGELTLTSPVVNLSLWGLGITWAILIGEIIFPLLFVLHKSSKVRHVAMLLLITTILATRLETGFLSLLSVIGIASCTDEDNLIQKVYICLFVILQAIFLFDYGYI